MFNFCCLFLLLVLFIANTTAYGSYVGSTFQTTWSSANQYCLDIYGTTYWQQSPMMKQDLQEPVVEVDIQIDFLLG